MSAVTFARLEFAVTAALHFLFVATTLGLAPVLAMLQTRHARAVRRGQSDSMAGRMCRQLMRLYLVNYGTGIVTGIVLEVQMGLNWSRVPRELYDPIGAALGIETIVAFFIESTLLGLWLVTAGRLGELARAGLLWGVAATAWLSAWLVMGANAYLHRPQGIEVQDGAARLVDPFAHVLSSATTMPFLHAVTSGLLVAAFWIGAAGAIQVRGADAALGRAQLRAGVLLGAISAPLVAATGFLQFSVVRDQGNTQFSAFGVLMGLMVVAGMAIVALTLLVMLPLALTGRLERVRALLAVMRFAPVVPLLLTLAGWVYREEARQPWMIVGHVTVDDALSAEPTALLIGGTASALVVAIAAVAGLRLMGRMLHRPADPPPAVPGTAVRERELEVVGL